MDFICHAGIHNGLVLEIGCGPGHLSLEWLKQARKDAELVGVDISSAMLEIVAKNSFEYMAAAKHQVGNVMDLPFDNDSFEGVFGSSSLHKWLDPVATLNEVARVLQPSGRYYIMDLRRDMDRVTFQIMKANIPAEIRPDFRKSVHSAYTKHEIEQILVSSNLKGSTVLEHPMGFIVTGSNQKERSI